MTNSRCVFIYSGWNIPARRRWVKLSLLISVSFRLNSSWAKTRLEVFLVARWTNGVASAASKKRLSLHANCKGLNLQILNMAASYYTIRYLRNIRRLLPIVPSSNLSGAMALKCSINCPWNAQNKRCFDRQLMLEFDDKLPTRKEETISHIMNLHSNI